jgi:hypothetical protein
MTIQEANEQFLQSSFEDLQPASQKNGFNRAVLLAGYFEKVLRR